MNETENPLTHRQLIVELLSRLHPDSDLTDEEVLFGIIYDDYTQYADVLERRESDLANAHAEGEIAGRNAKIEEMLSDEPSVQAAPASPPALGGANTLYSSHPFTSIFDIARGG